MKLGKKNVHLKSNLRILCKNFAQTNLFRPTEVSEPWLDCLLEEYFMQVGLV
jgi:hypothetical protein